MKAIFARRPRFNRAGRKRRLPQSAYLVYSSALILDEMPT